MADQNPFHTAPNCICGDNLSNWPASSSVHSRNLHSLRMDEFGLDVSGDFDDWNGCFDEIGINQKLKDTIMLPKIAAICCIFSAKHWVREVVEERFGFLRHLEDGGDPAHQTSIADFDVARKLPGNTASWQAGYNDFSGVGRAACFTPQKEVADQYAKWAKSRSPDQEVLVAKIFVPDQLFEKLDTQYLFCEDPGRPQDDWKRIFWHSRNGRRLPKGFPWVEKKDLLNGHILNWLRRNFRNQQEFDCETLNIQDAFHVNGKPAIQWTCMTSVAERYSLRSCARERSHSSQLVPTTTRNLRFESMLTQCACTRLLPRRPECD
ncbi:uncharacterized protein BKA78DRAFT_358629 [Phyllosticta capitalensis]|uniref:uncharacterized protein n=1 Tax=Phyllosticta capitalensis TaxID=121624 RepID=UPI00312D1392